MDSVSSPTQLLTQASAVLVTTAKRPATKKAGHKSPKTARAGTIKPKVVGSHPPYGDMVTKAVSELKERKGSSRAAILKYICSHYKVGDEIKKINANIKSALKRLVISGALKQVKGVGAAGSFRIGDKAAVAKPKKIAKKSTIADQSKAPKAKKTKISTKKAGSPKKAKIASKPAVAASTIAKPAPGPAPAKVEKTPKPKKAKASPKKAGKISKKPKSPATKKPAAKKLSPSKPQPKSAKVAKPKPVKAKKHAKAPAEK